MNVTVQIKNQKDLEMQPPPGFTVKVSNVQGKCTGADHCGNKGNEDESISKEDKKADSSNSSDEEEGAVDDDHCEQEPESAVLEVADPEFYDFDWNKREECFAVDQIWATYGYLDGMPRFYARIDKVYSPFKVDVTWLESIAGDMDETAWKTSGLPVACGKFKYDKTDTIEDIGTFSHKIFHKRSVNKSFDIYPQKGETWALYKNWNLKWSSDPDSHREYEYEFVVVLSDYSNQSGISVAHLVKLKGFVCLFKPTRNNGMASFQIPSNEMLRFSHRIPSFRTNGKEREDVLEGYFELDPYSLPSNLKDTESEQSTSKGKEDASLSMEDSKADSSYRGAAEVAEAEEHYEQEAELAVIEVVDPDFYDFGRDRTEEGFAVDQMWAIYKDFDGMPRSYARIDNVYSPFKVDVTWLEFVAGDIDEAAWKRSKLPIACGKFKHGKTDTIEHIRAFSHKILCEKSVGTSYDIYPEKGETWALYKNWNIRWSSDLHNHREYEYEFVVVLSDYTKESGISVALLDKVKGFECLFKLTKNNGMAFFQIPSNEILIFSHRVPSITITNSKEREDVPESYFELDPCSLPSNLEEISETVDGSTNSSLKSVTKEKPRKLHKRKTPDAESTLDGNSLGVKKSARMPNRCHKIPNEEKRAAEASDGLLDDSKATSVLDSEKTAAAHAKEMSPDGVSAVPGRVGEHIPSPPSYFKTFEMLNTEFCNFNCERSGERFKTGQVWALYCKLDKLPKIYARIESIESFPFFKLAVKWLQSCDPPRGIIPWSDKQMPVSCGRFKVTSTESVVFSASISFSHRLSISAINNMYTIYPRAGEVWALYSKFRFDLMHSDLKKCEYDIVEVLQVVDAHWIILSVLERVTGFKSVFKAKEKEGLDATSAIPWIDLYRFSHQVPTFMLSGAKYGNLRGFWELDPRALAVH